MKYIIIKLILILNISFVMSTLTVLVGYARQLPKTGTWQFREKKHGMHAHIPDNLALKREKTPMEIRSPYLGYL